MNLHLTRRRVLASTAAFALNLAGAGALAQRARKHTLSGLDIAGKPVRLQDLAGKVVMVSFVTGDCPVCTSEMRLLREFFSANQARGFAQLAVSLDRRPQDWGQFAEYMRSGVPAPQRFPMVWRHHPAHQDSFGELARTPTHVVLDRQGSEVSRRPGSMQPGDWDDLWSLIGQG